MLRHIRPALVMTVLFTLLTGVAYPLAITGMAQILAHSAANGSQIVRNGTLAGSALIGQNFTSGKYFHGRPSATNAPDPNDASKTIDAPYNAANSSGSNYGATSRKLIDRVKADVEARRATGFAGLVPGDAVTASASGLDPHISPDFAFAQAAAVASARNLPLTRVKELVEAHVEGRFLGLFGEPRVNVLLLNLALDAAL